jgi:hypothetical protein
MIVQEVFVTLGRYKKPETSGYKCHCQQMQLDRCLCTAGARFCHKCKKRRWPFGWRKCHWYGEYRNITYQPTDTGAFTTDFSARYPQIFDGPFHAHRCY